MLRTALSLIALTLTLGYAVVSYGGVLGKDQAIWLLGIGVTGLASWLIPSAHHIPSLERRLWIPMLLLPGYLMLQILPLPVSLLRILSPARWDLLRGLEPVMRTSPFASLSVMSPATFGHLLRVIGYSIVFLLVREAMWHLAEHPWVAALPVVAIGGFESAVGLAQYASDPATGFARGTYINRNHLAGLLEMVLPFAVMYTGVLFRRMRRARAFSALAALKLAAVTGIAVAMMLAIVYSL